MSNVHTKFLSADKDEAVISITKRSWLGFGKPKTRKYRGSCTVWRDMKTGHRVSTFMEARLCDIWQVGKWEMENIFKETPAPSSGGSYEKRAAAFLERVRDMLGYGYGEGDIENIFTTLKARNDVFERLTSTQLHAALTLSQSKEVE